MEWWQVLISAVGFLIFVVIGIAALGRRAIDDFDKEHNREITYEMNKNHGIK